MTTTMLIAEGMFRSLPEFLEILVIVAARILRFRQSSWQDPKGDSQIAGEVEPDRRPGVSVGCAR
jgi:hypothetical protein